MEMKTPLVPSLVWPRDAPTSLRSAQEYLEAGDAKGALEGLRVIVRLGAADASSVLACAYNNMGVIYFRLGVYDLAFRSFKRAVMEAQAHESMALGVALL